MEVLNIYLITPVLNRSLGLIYELNKSKRFFRLFR